MECLEILISALRQVGDVGLEVATVLWSSAIHIIPATIQVLTYDMSSCVDL